MVDAKITELCALTTGAACDVVAIVDVSPCPDVTKKMTFTNLRKDIAVSELANGTDGELITWSACAVPATVGVGTLAQVLTSNGAGAAPEFKAAAGGGLTFGKVITTADFDKTCCTTLSDVCGLRIALNACKTYGLFMGLHHFANTAPDAKWAFTVPACTSMTGNNGNFSSNGVGVKDYATSNFFSGTSANGFTAFGARVITSTTSGDLDFQWAQNSNSCISSTVRQGSFIIMWES